GLGIYLMSRLQQNEFDKVKKIMDTVGLKYHPADLQIKKEDLTAALLNLKNFVESRPQLWFTVINDAKIDEELIKMSLEGLKF
ncbi:MAG: hypothetical protein RJA52_949, partial [Bacteroidota bacterium]